MTRPSVYPLVVYRGDGYQWKFRLWQNAKKTVPIDLTDVTVRAEIREQSQGRNIIQLACAVTLPNIITMQLRPLDSLNISRPQAAWDMRLTYATGHRRTILHGQVTVLPDITDSTGVITEALGLIDVV